MILNFDRAFISREPDFKINDELIARIARSYRLAKCNVNGLSLLYEVGNEWTPIYRRYMPRFIVALNDEKNIGNLRRLLENFFREDFSTGLHGLHFEMVDRYMTEGRSISPDDAVAYETAVLAELDLLLKSIPDLDLKLTRMPIIGNPYGFEIGEKFFYNLGFIYFARKISMLLRNPTAHIVELGGGYGGLPVALRAAMPGMRYIDFDLPEVLAIASFFTFSAYPEARIGLYGEVDIAKDEINNYDFIFMPNWEITRLCDNWADMCFNSYSLAEMEPRQIVNYVEHLCRLASRYFMHVNHVTRCKFSADLFPIDYEKFELLHRAPAMWGKSSVRNNFVDEHEFVYVAR